MNVAAKRRLAGRTMDAKRRGGDRGRDDAEKVYVDPKLILEIHSLFARMTAGSRDRDFAELLDQLASNGPLLQQTLFYWVDLIELLVQTTEARYTPGSGPQKKDEVKAIVMFIVRTNKFELPASIPGYLRPVIVDVSTDVAVDAIVALFDQQDRLPGPNAWVVRPATRPSLSQRWRQLTRHLLRILETVFSPLARLGSRIYLVLRYPVKISPALKTALQAIEDESDLMRNRDAVADVVKVLQTVADNADALKAGVQLIGLVVQEVETFTDLSGPQKKVYARQLIFVVLEDLGVDTGGPIVSAKLGLAIDAGIDMVVHLFKKRQVLESRHPTAAGGDRAVSTLTTGRTSSAASRVSRRAS